MQCKLLMLINSQVLQFVSTDKWCCLYLQGSVLWASAELPPSLSLESRTVQDEVWVCHLKQMCTHATSHTVNTSIRRLSSAKVTLAKYFDPVLVSKLLWADIILSICVMSTYFLSAVPDLEEGLPVGASHFVWGTLWQGSFLVWRWWGGAGREPQKGRRNTVLLYLTPARHPKRLQHFVSLTLQ